MFHAVCHCRERVTRCRAGAHAVHLCAIAAPALLGACSTHGPLSTLAPAGPGAAAIAQLWWWMFWGAMALTLGMTVLGLVAVLRRRRTGAAAPHTGQAWLLGGGLVLPLLVIAALLLWGLRTGHALLPLPGSAPMFTVEVTARQWQWEVRYPAHPMAEAMPNRLDIPAGQPVDVRVRTADVIHSFWVPRLAGKIDAIPGRTNVVRLQADAPGVYRGLCAEYCGTGHAHMPIEVHAHAPEALAARMAGAAP